MLTELKRSFDFKGRTGRRDYLFFLLASVVAFVVTLSTITYLAPQSSIGWVILATTAIFYIPVTSAGVRRLHDVGESGTLMLEPLKPSLAVATLALSLAALISLVPMIGSFVLLLAMFTPLVAVIFLGTILAALIYTAMFFSHTMGLLFLPSQPGPNNYGPNPHEVPQ